jgi:hypothetical protein
VARRPGHTAGIGLVFLHDQPGLFQYLDVHRNGRQRRLEWLGELVHGRITLGETGQYRSAGRVGQRGEGLAEPVLVDRRRLRAGQAAGSRTPGADGTVDEAGSLAKRPRLAQPALVTASRPARPAGSACTCQPDATSWCATCPGTTPPACTPSSTSPNHSRPVAPDTPAARSPSPSLRSPGGSGLGHRTCDPHP